VYSISWDTIAGGGGGDEYRPMLIRGKYEKGEEEKGQIYAKRGREIRA
jgi:hypothetical protein